MDFRSTRRRAALVAIITTAVVGCDSALTTQPVEVGSGPAFSHLPTHKVFTSGAHVDTWNAIVPVQTLTWQTTVCVPNPAVGLNANWTNQHKAFVANGAAFQTHSNVSGTFTADWINAWPGFEWSGLTAQYGGPPGSLQQSWTRYSTSVSGNGEFVLYLAADNCSWIYLTDASGNNPQLVGVQLKDPRNAGVNITYPVTLSGDHRIEFIVFDGGGQSGGMFKLETNSNIVFADTDGDGLADVAETNIHSTNPNNPDTDGDGTNDGDEVAAGTDPLAPEVTDSDGDGVADGDDNCISEANPDQADFDGDGLGDACDPDMDNDGVPNGSDAYPTDPTRSSFDADNDGVIDESDNCPAVSNGNQADLDNDGVGDACDSDIDGDGAPNGSDAFPTNPAETTDSDGDRVGDNSDAFPLDPTESVDSDGDGVGDNGDNCSALSNSSQADQDNDGVGDACDSDIDGDGAPNASDAFPTNPAETTDSDGDGVGNNADPFDNSNTGAALVVGACNPGVANWRISGGTWANDLIAAAYTSAANHGAFVSAVTTLSNGWKSAGRISGKQHGAIVSCAARTK